MSLSEKSEQQHMKLKASMEQQWSKTTRVTRRMKHSQICPKQPRQFTNPIQLFQSGVQDH